MSKVAICPTITAFEPHQYRTQMELIEPFSKRIHIDLMDGEFAPHLSPTLEQVWWPESITADLHLMYAQPAEHLNELVKLKPNLVVIHYEAQLNHLQFAQELQASGIKAGLAILQATSVEETEHLFMDFDHVMVYSGHLGEHGGQADLGLLDKVRLIRQNYPTIEISWDGGINDHNAQQLVEAGVDVLNVGGFIHAAADPQAAYAKLIAVV